MMSNMRSVFPLTTVAIALGVHVRSGIEENLRGPRKSERMTTVKQVEWQAERAGRLGRKVATEEAREIFKIGTWYDSVEETLANLGLPPNCEDQRAGFLVKKTDGKTYELTFEEIGDVPRRAGQGDRFWEFSTAQTALPLGISGSPVTDLARTMRRRRGPSRASLSRPSESAKVPCAPAPPITSITTHGGGARPIPGRSLIWSRRRVRSSIAPASRATAAPPYAVMGAAYR